MWIFVKDAFFSVVEDRMEPERLMVRARLPGDLEAHFPGADVIEHAPGEADYRFRVFLPRPTVEAWVLAQLQGVDYPDFKSQIPSDQPRRYRTYMQVWTVMNSAQRDALEYGLSDLLDD